LTFDVNNLVIKYYDSIFNEDNGKIFCNILKKNMVTLYEKKSVPLNSNAIKSIVVNDMPQQTNGSDCGIYTIAYMDLIYDNIPLTSLTQPI